jgi:hypothetical protein
MKSDYKLIENFYPTETFEELQSIILPGITVGDYVAHPEINWVFIPISTEALHFVHMVYLDVSGERKDWGRKYDFEGGQVLSPLYEKIVKHLKIAIPNIRGILRIKLNMYLNGVAAAKFPDTEDSSIWEKNKEHACTYLSEPTDLEHGMHTDYDFSHTSAILSINKCDGYTKMEDGTKIDSVPNRIVIFDGSKPHTSSTTTDAPIRININYNWFSY